MTRVPPAQICIAVLLCISSVMIGIGMTSWWASVVVMALCAVHVVTGFELAHKPRGLWGVLLVLPFSLWYRSIAQSDTGDEGPGMLLMMMGAYTLALGTYHLLCTKHGGKLSHAAFCAVFAFAVAGVVSRQENRFYVPTVFVFVPLVVVCMRLLLGAHGKRRHIVRHYVTLGIAGAVAFALAFGVQYAVKRGSKVDDYIVRAMNVNNRAGSQIGFAQSARLGSVSDSWDRGNLDDMMLRVWTDTPSTYMRGLVYDTYQGGQWSAIADRTEAARIGRERSRRIYNIVTTRSPELSATVFNAPEVRDAIFTPIHTHQVSTFGRQLMYSRAFTMHPSGRETEGGYGIFVSIARQGEPTPADLVVPAELEEPLRELAQSLIADIDEEAIAASVTDPEPTAVIGAIEAAKAERITRFFEQHFTYKIGIDIKPDKDPILQFVQDIRSGHCEYFASAAVMMLRSIGIPARYVTGFVVQEQGATDGLWLARRKDAHAWVEAYFTHRGWSTVEATPPSARPAAIETSTGERWVDQLKAYWERLVRTARAGGVMAVVSLMWEVVLGLIDGVPAWLWVSIVVGGLAWSTREQWLRWFKREKRRHVTPTVKALQMQLERAEQMLRKHQVVREPSTTVIRFLETVREAELPREVEDQVVELLEDYVARRFVRDAAQA